IYGRNQHLETGNPARFHGTREARGLTDDEPEQDLDTAVRFHPQRTVDNLIELRTLAPDIPWMPVLQGWTLQHYLDCLAMYTDAG
ncbi:hypothetical protein KBZ21_38050, partial [Streptomyces sp. A73]|nr:hypothetical protein [Streptomyces sp. A73]